MSESRIRIEDRLHYETHLRAILTASMSMRSLQGDIIFDEPARYKQGQRFLLALFASISHVEICTSF
jgi:hypothetical protein